MMEAIRKYGRMPRQVTFDQYKDKHEELYEKTEQVKLLSLKLEKKNEEIQELKNKNQELEK